MAEQVGTTPDRPALRAIHLSERLVLWSGLGAITLLGWLYLVWMPMAPGDFGSVGRSILRMMPASVADAALMFLMWAVMMVAMMLPSAAPMIETYARLVAGRGEHPGLRVWIFAAGYLVAWTLFSGVATAAQLSMQRIGAVTGAMTATPIVGAALLIMAGAYQLTPLKNACLTRCRTPLGFLMSEWRDGAAGALMMGVRHGAICLGCCSMLMILLFVFGVMNLVWVAALSIFVVLEKLLPGGRLIARVSGVAMLAAGLAILMR
jgi:predicted metal-binding membrane protein